MSSDVRLYLEDIRERTAKVLHYTDGMSRKDFFSDEKTYDAVLRNLEIVGEAAKHVPADVRTRHPEIEWKKIAGLRDFLVHAYFGVDDDIVWDIVDNKVRTLQIEIQRVLAVESSYLAET